MNPIQKYPEKQDRLSGAELAARIYGKGVSRMRHRFGLLCLLLASIAFAAGGCVVAAEPPAVAVAVPAPFVWIGPGYYGDVYYHGYPGPGYYAPHRHYWR
jgi:hypothetical protein